MNKNDLYMSKYILLQAFSYMYYDEEKMQVFKYLQVFPKQIMDMSAEGLLDKLDIQKCFDDDLETPFRSLRLDLARQKKELRVA